MKKTAIIPMLLLMLIVYTGSIGMTAVPSEGYLNPDQIITEVEKIANDNKDLTTLHRLIQTPGGRDLVMLEMGTVENAPAILVVANMEGNYPLASEAAVKLAQWLVQDWKEELNAKKWYIVPLGNPDGYAGFFENPLTEKFTNERPFNDDKDDAVNEDGPDDLNGDGFITTMRQLHPEGEWLEVGSNPLMLKKADRAKGEVGLYRLFEEGIDNDSDGDINEDGPGGANPGHNFPHDFKHFTKTNGTWAASEVESRTLLTFAYDHPEIAMVLTFGRTNTVASVPESSRKAAAADDSYKVPKRWAERMGLDADKKYPIKELLEMARDFTGYKELTEDMLLQWLGAGAAVNPDRNDLTYWNEISEKYKEFIKEAGLEEKRLETPSLPSGSVEEWAYYQYGVPCFAMDFWTLPEPEEEKKAEDSAMLTPDEVEKMSNEEFIELGEEKIAEFLKTSGTPAQFTAEMVINALKGGMMNTKRMAKFMRDKAKEEESGGADEADLALFAYDSTAFLTWQSYDHPTLGKVEIGGKVPYAALAPPYAEAESLLVKQLPFVRELAGMLPEITIDTVIIEKKGTDIWKVTAWVANNGFLPYPTHQGDRCKRPTPAVVTLENKTVTFLEGKKRNVLELLSGSHGVKEVNWLLQAEPGSSIIIKAHSFSAGSDERSVVLEGGGK